MSKNCGSAGNNARRRTSRIPSSAPRSKKCTRILPSPSRTMECAYSMIVTTTQTQDKSSWKICKERHHEAFPYRRFLEGSSNSDWRQFERLIWIISRIDGDWVTKSNCTVWHNFHYKQISLTEITQEHQLFFRILRRSASRIAVHHRWKNYHPTLLQYSPLDGLDNRPGLDQQGTSRGEDVRSQPCSRRSGEDRCFKMATHQIPR